MLTISAYVIECYSILNGQLYEMKRVILIGIGLTVKFTSLLREFH